MRQGLTPEISAAKQTNLQYLVKLRGRTVVHIGIRDSIVHVERRKTALTTIVSVATAKTQAKTGAGITAWFENRLQRY